MKTSKEKWANWESFSHKILTKRNGDKRNVAAMGNSRWAAKKYSFSHRLSSFFLLLRASFKIYPLSFVVPFVEVGQYLLLFLVQISWQSRLSPQFPFLTAIYFLALIETSFPFSFSLDFLPFLSIRFRVTVAGF